MAPVLLLHRLQGHTFLAEASQMTTASLGYKASKATTGALHNIWPKIVYCKPNKGPL